MARAVIFLLPLLICLGMGLHPVTHDGSERNFYIFTPKDIGDNPPCVIVLHGGGKPDGDGVAKRIDLNPIAEREGFIAVYPNGIDSQWNDGRGSTFRRKDDNTDIDDVGFLSAVMDTLISGWNVDPERIYILGISNGGMMALRLGCEIPDRIAAMAVLIASIPLNIIDECDHSSPLPILIMNSTDDPFVPWDGGKVTILGREHGHVVSTWQTVEHWKGINNTQNYARIDTLPDIFKRDRSTVIRHIYGGEAPVILYEIKGGGHNVPSSDFENIPFLLGRKNRDIEAMEEIWGFFDGLLT